MSESAAAAYRAGMVGHTGDFARRAFVNVGALPLLLAGMIVFFTLQNPTFISAPNLLTVSAQGVFLLLIALGQMLVLVSGGFDLSVGANVGLTSIASATVMSAVYAGNPAHASASIAAGLATAIVVGVAVGLANGIGVAVFKVNAFIVTLATASVFAGITLLISQGQEVSGLPHPFVYDIGSGSLGPLPIPVLLTLPVVIAILLLLNLSRYGRYVYAIGSNAAAARVAGIRVALQVLATYVICAVVTSYAGWLLTARVSAGEPLLGGEFTLQSITAAVIGGTSLRGGEGGVGGTILGVLFVMVLTNGMNLMRLGSNQQMIALGLALVLAVIVDRQRAGLRDRIAG